MPRSPRWLVKQGDFSGAERTLQRLRQVKVREHSVAPSQGVREHSVALPFAFSLVIFCNLSLN